MQRPEPREDIGFAPIGLDEPYRIVVGNNPVNFVDPLGLMGTNQPRKKKKQEYQTGDFCINQLAQRKRSGACPTEDDCTLCCAELSGPTETEKFLPESCTVKR